MSVTAFLTDSTLCIGCKACEVACKEWNQISEDGFDWKGFSYDNTGGLGHSTWRHVKFVEGGAIPGVGGNSPESFSWGFSSDVCKHCENAGCLEACPTGAIVRTEFGGVFVQPDVCNGCAYCIVACPFGVVERNPAEGKAFKCTFCYDRQKEGLKPACATACPTESIKFGEIDDLREIAQQRMAKLGEAGFTDLHLYDPQRFERGRHSRVLHRPRRSTSLQSSARSGSTHHLSAQGMAFRRTGRGPDAGRNIVSFQQRRLVSEDGMNSIRNAWEVREQRLYEIRREAERKGAAVSQIEPTSAADRASAENGYYGTPLLKRPQWTVEIPIYFFVGGAAGVASVIAAVGQMSSANRKLIRDARWLAAIGGAISPALLISDLGVPSRFLNMLRVFKIQSPMSVGSWTLVAFSNTAAAAAVLGEFQKRRSNGAVKVITDAAQLASALAGMVLATYTGVLIGATAIPVWNEQVGRLPIHFAASGASAASSILELAGNDSEALNKIAIGAAAIETFMGLSIERSTTAASQPLRSGATGWAMRGAGMLSGPVPLALRILSLKAGKRRRGLRRAAAISSIVGSLLTRLAWVEAGKASAADNSVPLQLDTARESEPSRSEKLQG